MMKNLIDYLLRRTVDKKVQREDLQPVEYGGKGIVRFQMSTIKRLEEIQNRAAWHSEQMEALADECCELLGCDPMSAEMDSDYAADIVYVQTPIGDALDNIIHYRSKKEKECQ